ncbi:putative membrane protein [[Clostridium] cellulosi]|uniref:Putative membrane protein n=1 Tax=[Clostridium] cellulosi TaxID=29343 RepID=A0A078KU42_9FIRM|nr:MAG: YggT family protein [[Clostridium] cellulosi]CDZ24700.1 putative membrane protein [[Clostridium] cellulosi]
MPFLLNVVRVLNFLVYLITTLIVLRALVSWFPVSQSGKFISFLDTMTEPVVSPVRSLLYKFKFTRELPVDFSPVIAIFLLFAIRDFLNLVLLSFA